MLYVHWANAEDGFNTAQPTKTPRLEGKVSITCFIGKISHHKNIKAHSMILKVQEYLLKQLLETGNNISLNDS